MSKFDDLRGILKAIQECTQPCDGHTDPKSINDCWNEVFDIINELEKETAELKAKSQIKRIQDNVLAVSKRQLVWKNEAIDKAIDVLTEITHRYRDEACKKLLAHLKNMPFIQAWDIDVENNDLLF